MKGHTNNPNGRPKGTPNKTTDKLRGLFQSFLEANIETLQSDFDQLEPKDRLWFIERIAKMTIPVSLRKSPVNILFTGDLYFRGYIWGTISNHIYQS